MAVFANLRKGSEAIEKASQSGGKTAGFFPSLRWKEDNEKHYVLFLQSMDDIPTVMYHKMLDCGTNPKTGKTMWRDFISRRDPKIDGPTGYDPFADLGYAPTNRTISIVCEMEPVFEGKKIVSFEPMMRSYDRKTDEGTEEVTEPAIYLVIESPSTFFKPLTAYAAEIGPIEDQVFVIQRKGKDQNTTYAPIAYNLDFTPPENIDAAMKRLEDHVEELADEDRMRGLYEAVGPDHVFNKFVKMKADKGAPAASKSTSTAAASSAAPASKPAAAAKPKKRSRFEELQAELSGN